MKPSIYNLDQIDFRDLSDDMDMDIKCEVTSNKNNHVAIIGMSGKVGETSNLEEFWNMLVDQKEGFQSLSDERKNDIDVYLKARDITLPIDSSRYIGGTRFKNISRFDYKFFSMSLQEAKSMDPNQRIFLETAWEALEDAGYATENIKGKDVGIYVGFSSDFGEEYRRYIQEIAPDAAEVVVAGNIKSMIASRLSYYLNLKGPALLLDTACSSGLVAAYTAFRAIQNGECSMAIVGGVKCDILPVASDSDSGVGIKDIQDTASSDNHTKTFDYNCEGTSTAEGSFAFVLKSFNKAMEENDNIHAVIIGGAINQDGASNGITAPNAEAQGDLIEKALYDSGIDAEEISYIEAHGTATKLGDPIEISGIHRAFSRRTKRKQFCAIGSVKTNIGHMDNSSGLAGLAKLILSMKHKILPASLNFKQPNPNIPFVQSPVYVNDRTVSWENLGNPLYAGINSFGLSGTNCHLILKSPPENHKTIKTQEIPLLLPISGKSQNSLKRLLERYFTFLKKEKNSNLIDMVYTAAVGRMHYNYRIGLVFRTKEELLTLLKLCLENNLEEIHNEHIFFGEHKYVISKSGIKNPKEITDSERQQLYDTCLNILSKQSNEETMKELANIYRKGGEMPWTYIFQPLKVHKISIPTYPFEPYRCWMEASEKTFNVNITKKGMFFQEEIISTHEHYICINYLSVKDFWELKEHRIHGACVLPGTAILEMIVGTLNRLPFINSEIELHNITFEAPLIVKDEEIKQIHIILEEENQQYLIKVAGKLSDGNWEQYAQGVLLNKDKVSHKSQINIKEIISRLNNQVKEDIHTDLAKGLKVSDRWYGSYQEGYMNDDMTEIIVKLQLPSPYQEEIKEYFLHPALMDTAMNAVNNLYDKEKLYLPLSYGKLCIYSPLESTIYVYFKRKKESLDNRIYAFDVVITDIWSKVLMEVKNYYIKSAESIHLSETSDYGYIQSYKKIELPKKSNIHNGRVLLCGRFTKQYGDISLKLTELGFQCIEMNMDKVDSNHWNEILKDKEFTFGLFQWAPYDLTDETSWERNIKDPVMEGLKFVKLITSTKVKFTYGVTALTYHACNVSDKDTVIMPGQAALMGLWRVAALEYEYLKLQCLDLDEILPAKMLIDELTRENREDFIIYRDKQSYKTINEKYNIINGRNESSLDTDGVIIISGGTGEIGLEVAYHLQKNNFKKIILLGKSQVSTWKEEWNVLKAGCDVFEIIGLNLENYEEVERTLNDVKARYGNIIGIFHLAGKAGDGFIHNKSMEEFMEVYACKAMGAINLHLATRKDKLKYFVVFSSISSLLLNVGQSDYTAANMVLDALAEYRQKQGLQAVSIQWPAWREIGIAKRMNAVDEEEYFSPLNTEEAIQLLNHILKMESTPSVIMPGMKKTVRKEKKGKIANNLTEVFSQTHLYGLEHPDEIDLAIATIWGKTLDVKEVDVHDEFSELGGNSLLTSQMLKLYEMKYPGLLDITDLFKYTTILKQAEYIKSKLGMKNQEAYNKSVIRDKKNIDDILDMVEKGELSVEESKKLV